MWLFFKDNQAFRIFDPKTWVQIAEREHAAACKSRREHFYFWLDLGRNMEKL